MDIYVALLVIIVILFLTWRWKHTSIFTDLGIPGPKPNLLFGNLIELYIKGPIQCHNEWQEKYGRIYGYYYGMKPILLVTDPQIIKNVFIKDFPKFINRAPFSPLFRLDPKNKLEHSVLSLKGQKWKQVRNVLTPTFTTAKMKQMAVSMNSCIELMVHVMREKADKGLEFNIQDTLQRLTIDVISRTAFGVLIDVQTNSKSRMLPAVQLLFSNIFRDPIVFIGLSFPWLRLVAVKTQITLLKLINRGIHPIKVLRAGMFQVLKDRRNQTQARNSDLLQLMLDAKIQSEEGEIDVRKLEAGHVEMEEELKIIENEKRPTRQMDDEEIIATAVLVFLAGYETTSTALSFTSYLLAKHQDVQEKAFQEIYSVVKNGEKLDYATINKLPYLEQVLNESMRIYPPVYLFTNREAIEDVQYGDLKIPKEMQVQAPVYQLHHDPEFWDDPEVFKPERFASKPSEPAYFMPFGMGPRNCLGMRFAQMEAKLALAHMIYNFKLILGDRHKDGLKTTLRIRMMSPRHGIYVKLEARQAETNL